MKKMTIAAMMAVCASLTACATTEQPAGTPGAPEVKVSLLDSDSTLTGSRIPARKTEKMVTGMTGQDYDRDIRNKANPFEAR